MMTKKECNCGNYYSYGDMLKNRKNGGMVAMMMPIDNCFNCYLIKRYGSTEPEVIKAKKMEEALKTVEVLKKRKGRKERKTHTEEEIKKLSDAVNKTARKL